MGETYLLGSRMYKYLEILLKVYMQAGRVRKATSGINPQHGTYTN